MTANIDLAGVDSSYKKNSYGDFFYSIVKIHKPKRIVELGTYMGYSALHIAAGIRDCADVASYFTIIDLGNEYKFRHCSLETTRENFRKNDLLELKNCKVEFLNEDAFECAAAFENDSIDLLHVDLSNDGKSLRKTLDQWHHKLKINGLLLTEGGSQERDKIDWMIKFDKTPIGEFLNSDWYRTHYEFTVLSPFPSLTFARKIS